MIKHLVIFVRNVHGTYHHVKSLKMKEKDVIEKNIRFSDKTYFVELDNPTKVAGTKFIHVIDIDKNRNLSYGDVNPDIDPSEVDILLNRGVIGQLATSFVEKKFDVKPYVFGGFIGAFITFLVSVILVQVGVW